MKLGLRKLVLTVHLTSSVGWIGAVIAYLSLVVAAMTKQDAQTLRFAWFAMEQTGWSVIAPLALASFVSGLVISVGTRWGLFQHYWVLLSLVLTLFATVVLFLHLPTVNTYASLAAETPSASIGGLGGELFHAGVGLLVLIVIQLLNVYKPHGLTPYGWRKQQEHRITRVEYGHS